MPESGRRLFAWTIVIATAGVCALGCHHANKEVVAPGTMRIGLGAPAGGTRRTGATAVVNLLKSDPWLASKPDGQIAERIAVAWSWDAAGTTLHLTIRPDVYFHDGTLLTPDIAAASLRASVAAADASSLASISSVTPSADGVEIHLKERNAFLLPDLTGVMVIKPGSTTVGVGPYQVEKVDNQGGVLTVFPKYYRGRPALAKITVTNYPTQRNAWTALMRGDIDMLYEVSRDAAEFVKAESTVRSYPFPRPYYIPLVFNVRNPILRDAEVRQAINQALDREALVRDGMSGKGTPADGPIFPQNWAYSPPPMPFTFDPVAAKRRLDVVRARIKGRSGSKEGARLTFTCLVFANDARFERLAAHVQKQLADVGVDMKLEPVPEKELGRRLQAGEFDAFLFEMAGRTVKWVYDFWRYRDAGLNNSGYHSADAVLDRIRGALSDEEVRRGVVDLQRILHDDPPAAFLVWQEQTRAVSTKFDVAAEPNRDILINLWQWRLASAASQAAR
ncbi:MAG: ABC transporter substrate-binding protein [Vicinamibacterales bacterium]